MSDNESAVGSWRTGHPELTEQFEAFGGTLGFRIIQCRPAGPEAKGLVERADGYLETSFLLGRAFASPADFNGQLEQGCCQRTAGSTKRWVAGRIEVDRAAMLTLPPVPPAIGWTSWLRLPRDHYVRMDSNDYSVAPAAVGRLSQVRADLQ